MMNKICVCGLSVFLSSVFLSVPVFAQADSPKTSAPSSYVPKIKNPYAGDRAKIDAMERKQRSLPVGKKRDEMGVKIKAEEDKLKAKMKKNVAVLKRTLEKLQKQRERAKDPKKQKELGIKINQILAEIALHEAWASGEAEKLEDALAMAERAFSPNAGDYLDENEGDSGSGKPDDGTPKTPAEGDDNNGNAGETAATDGAKTTGEGGKSDDPGDGKAAGSEEAAGDGKASDSQGAGKGEEGKSDDSGDGKAAGSEGAGGDDGKSSDGKSGSRKGSKTKKTDSGSGKSKRKSGRKGGKTK